MKTRDFKTEWKVKGDTGAFSGYAAVFGNVDDGYDVVMPGAFKEFARTKDGKVIVLHQHRTSEYLGLADVKSDEKGLAVDGQLVLEDPLARRVYTHMKAGTLDAMSFGYDVLPGGAHFTEAGIRQLLALKTWEVSIVTFGMNELARIEMVKNAGNISTIREFEDFLRDAGGYSVRQARAIAEGGYKALQSARDEPDPGAAIATLFEQRLFRLD